ncbi:unnamed protein product [Darwinula stevensoni]|uniref:Hormone-sensitive lipase n=1 Tax=Darwinula stevensoni TaxID=69355 RepID=A0A7R8X4F5_9CRUS|nr:unnamed protein product [Darwinula stevensoni]CAG0883655.1 unnamed protein product [Darwinula stevensoni]
MATLEGAEDHPAQRDSHTEMDSDEDPVLDAKSSNNLWELVEELALNNIEHFRTDESENGQRLYEGFQAFLEHLRNLRKIVPDVKQISPDFDFDSKVRGNGYRSFVMVVDACLVHCAELSRTICTKRDSTFFQKKRSMREVEAWGQVLASLTQLFEFLKRLHSWSEKGCLFPSDYHSPEELLLEATNLNQYCFYGRCLGFQFVNSMRRALKMVSLSMASFSEVYYNSGSIFSRTTQSILAGGRCWLDPEYRARRIVNLSQNATVDFCKSFWLLADSELLSQLPGVVCPAIAVNKVIAVPPEPLEMPKADSRGMVSIPIPTAHGDSRAIPCRLLSSHWREGMVSSKGENRKHMVLPTTSSLVIHCHGGGFIACTSASHEIYLREWAAKLEVPIFSIDYSLAPEAPYPRALEEVFYAYCWALRNAHLLGSTAERVVLVGDSAGGNLVNGITMKCIKLGVRIPTGIFLIYAPNLIQFIPSPSRLLCLMDPLLPFGVLMKCLKAYAGHTAEEPIFRQLQEESRLPLPIPNGSPKEVDEPNTILPVGQDMLKTSPGSGTCSPSDTESFVEVSESDMQDMATMASVSLSLASDPSPGDEKPELTSQEYVDDFLEKYVLDSETDSMGQKVHVVRAESLESDTDEHVLFEFPQDLSHSFSKRIGAAARSIKDTFTGWRSRGQPVLGIPVDRKRVSFPTLGKFPAMAANFDSLGPVSPAVEFKKFQVSRDPFISPYLASDDLLMKFPPTHLLTVHLDPCLDDCVMFAKRLRALNVQVALDILPEMLPHGFLNFSQSSKEAHAGSMECIQHIRILLGLLGTSAATP